LYDRELIFVVLMWEKSAKKNFHQTKKKHRRFEKKAHTRASRDSSYFIMSTIFYEELY